MSDTGWERLRWGVYGWRLARWTWRIYLLRSYRNRTVYGLAVCAGPVTFGVTRTKVNRAH